MADRKKNNEVIENISTSLTKGCILLLNDDIMYRYKYSILHDTTYIKYSSDIFYQYAHNIIRTRCRDYSNIKEIKMDITFPR